MSLDLLPIFFSLDDMFIDDGIETECCNAAIFFYNDCSGRTETVSWKEQFLSCRREGCAVSR